MIKLILDYEGFPFICIEHEYEESEIEVKLNLIKELYSSANKMIVDWDEVYKALEKDPKIKVKEFTTKTFGY